MDVVRILEQSRQAWRNLAWKMELGQVPLRVRGDSAEIIEDDAGDLLCVSYGVHGYPISLHLIRGTVDCRLRKHALRIEGDVRTTKRPVRPE